VTTHAYQLLHRLGAHAKRYAYLHLRPTNTALGTLVPRSLRVCPRAALATPHPTVIALSVSLLPLELEREQENAAIEGAHVEEVAPAGQGRDASGNTIQERQAFKYLHHRKGGQVVVRNILPRILRFGFIGLSDFSDSSVKILAFGAQNITKEPH